LRATGLDFPAILQRQIFDPLAMKDSGVNFGDKVVERLEPGYVNKDGAWHYPPFNNLTQTFGAGCVYATATDLLKFLRALATRQILKAETVDWIREPKAGPYSYGWFTRQVGGKRVVAASEGCRDTPASSH
jgi:CubicO group peptidase (beta-lactamase class C family)